MAETWLRQCQFKKIKPSNHPKGFSELAKYTPSLATTDSINYENMRMSFVATIITYILIENPTKFETETSLEYINASLDVVDALEANLCSSGFGNLSVLQLGEPKCQDSSVDYNYDQPLTFLDTSTVAVRYVYENSNLFWISTTRKVHELRQQVPLILSKNFFGKQVHPVVQAWWESGLEDFSVRIKIRRKHRKKESTTSCYFVV